LLVATAFALIAAGCASPPAEKPAPAPVEPRGDAGRTVDLLKRVEPKRDSITGVWYFADDGALVCPPVRAARLQVSADLPDEYVLSFTVERKTGNNSFVFGVPLAGGRRAVVVLGARMPLGPTCGLDILDGVPFDSNETSNVGPGFTQNKPAEVVCTVTRNSVAVTIDGKPATKYDGEFTRLSEQEWWKTKDPRAVMLGGWDSEWRISRVELRAGK
jgi:hypothetical protein